MTVAAATLLVPVGFVEPTSFFPGKTPAEVLADISGYVAEGVTKAQALGLDAADVKFDPAVTAWAYYRAFDAVYNRLLVTPSSFSVEGESNFSYSSAQIEAIGEQSRKFLAQWNRLTVTVAAPVSSTTTVKNRFRF